jgi:hypothetical protein
MELDRPRVLIAHALMVYAESLAVLLAERRPCLAIRLLAPAELEAAVAAAPGAVVVTDRLTQAVEAHASGWLLYYPDRENVSIDGGQDPPRRIEVPRFAEILRAIDGLVARCFSAVPRPRPAATADAER